MILLIDDDSVNNLVNTRIIRRHFGFDPTVFDEAERALQHLQTCDRTQFPELILLDINMPEMNGWDFLDALKTLPMELQHECRVIMLSSSIDVHDFKKASSYPFVQDFISKPLTAEALNVITA
jgi:CheY-like chemotaxis protein